MILQNSLFTQFIQAAQSVADDQDVSQSLNAMQTWRNSLWQSLQQNRFDTNYLNPQGDIAKQIQHFDTWLAQQQQDSQIAYEQLSSAKDLIAQLEQKVILLVFGKFNAGKSSFCNILANYFRQCRQTVQYFYLDQSHPEHGDIVFTDEPFKEGATETTSRLQGICLGSQLVLLDTPGLHSITIANSKLTQRFLESADGVLWLSSSSSPGQVHELDNLVQELLRQKPLLPIITRSDYFEEDEVDGEICQVLCNKPSEQRQIQEQDVEQRATEKLIQMQVNPAMLKSPISLSAYMASQANFEQTAIDAAGFNRLFLALTDFIQPTIAYKQRKPAEIILHYLQEHILAPIYQGFGQILTQLEKTLQAQINSLDDERAHIIAQVWREIVPTFPTLMDKYGNFTQHDIELLVTEVNQAIRRNLQNETQQTLSNAIIETNSLVNFELQSAIVYQTNEKDSEQQVVNEELLYKNLCESLSSTLQQMMDTVIKQYHLQLENLIEQSTKLKSNLYNYQQQLDQIAIDFRNI